MANSGSKKKAKKINKSAAKTCLDSFSNLEFESLQPDVYKGIVLSLKTTFKEYIESLKSELDETTHSKDARIADKILKKTSSCFVFGFNSVMRGLEKGQIGGVFVNSSTKPFHLISAFIPVCRLKSVPIISVNELSGMFQNKIPIHSALAVGLTNHACDKNGPFRDVYVKCCNALKYEHLLTSENASGTVKIKAAVEPQQKSSLAAVSVNVSYHLKRESKHTRAFQPKKRSANAADTSFLNISNANKKKNPTIKPSKPKNTSTASATLNECSFFIDAGEEEEEPKNTLKSKKRKKSSARFFDSINSTSSNASYMPAKLKRIKGNTNRKT